MSKKINTVLSNVEPNSNDTLWLKPVTGGVAAYLREMGAYKPLKLMDDKGTPSTDDDTPATASGGFTGQIIMNYQSISPDSEGNINLGTVITSHQDISGKADVEDVAAIQELIPAQASSSNKLADKDFVNSSISTNTGTYRGSWNLWTDLEIDPAEATHEAIVNHLNLQGQADNNDYCFVEIPTSIATPNEIERIERYKYTGTTWNYEYTLNNSGFTAMQWAAINSGITSSTVSELNNLVHSTSVPSVRNIVVLTQAQYDALATKDANTEYNIIESV